MSPFTLAAYAQVNRLGRDEAESFTKLRYRIEKCLERTFSPPECTRLRGVMNDTGAIVSGIAALEFFCRRFLSKSSLDILVNKTQVDKLTSWLLEKGFAWLTESGKTEYGVTLYTVGSEAELAVKLVKFALAELQSDDLSEGIPNICGTLLFGRDKDVPVRLVVTMLPPVQVVLSFHSSKSL